MKYISRIIPATDVEKAILSHLQQKKPFSLIRINDGENRFLGHPIFGKLIPSWLPYTGVNKDDSDARNALIRAIKEADMVGLPIINKPNFRPLAEKVFTYYKLNPHRICKGTINIELYKNGAFRRILPGVRTILLGSTLPKVAHVFKEMGAIIVGMEPVNGFKDIPRVMRKIQHMQSFDLALVAAGFPAKTLCVEIRKTMGKVAMDIGHVPEVILYPDEVYLNVIRRYLKNSSHSSAHQKADASKDRIQVTNSNVSPPLQYTSLFNPMDFNPSLALRTNQNGLHRSSLKSIQ